MDAAQLQADAERFLQIGDAEEIVYTPRGGTPRTILALVDRNPPRDIAETPEATMADSIDITVINRATSQGDDDFGGIASATVDCGGDTVTLARRLGKAATVQSLQQILDHDAGMMRLEVR